MKKNLDPILNPKPPVNPNPRVTYDGQLLDITGAEYVEVDIRKDGKVLWVNVNGICRLRICWIKDLMVHGPSKCLDHKSN